MQYLALLRGINVGGNNIIRMVELKACLEGAGLLDVVTYIQSGNVIFLAPKQDVKKLTERIESILSRRFGYSSKVVVLSYAELSRAVKEAPDGFGSDPGRHRYNVIFLKPPLAAREALKDVSARDGVDEVHSGKGVLYFRILVSKAAQSRLSKVITMPVYKSMTIRNWNTTTKLLALMSARA